MIKLLDSRIPADRSLWVERWSQSPYQEPMAHPSYAQLFAREGDVPACVLYEDNSATVLFPLILRPLAMEPWAAGTDKGWDAVTPYGYGGPLRWGPGEMIPERFWSTFRTLAAERRIICIFARLSLFEEELVPSGCEWVVEEASQNVVIDLRKGGEQLWRAYAHKVRKNVKRAQSSGLVVEVDTTGARLEEFLAIYSETMDRRDASSWYRFDRTFFRRLVDGLPGNVLFFHALAPAGVVSTELVLVSSKRLYSFLGGTRVQAYAMRPNDLLKHAVVGWGVDNGKASFVLGGGYQRDDGIFQYKKGFAPDGVMPFKIAKLTLDVAAYADRVERRQCWEKMQGRTWESRSSFYPAYRS